MAGHEVGFWRHDIHRRKVNMAKRGLNEIVESARLSRLRRARFAESILLVAEFTGWLLAGGLVLGVATYLIRCIP